MPILELNGVTKTYTDAYNRATPVLQDINLSIEEGEFVAIVGFSGTGKTTLISMLAGLTEPDEGEALYKGKPLRGPSPERGLVFQNYSLLPWLTVAGNVGVAVNEVHKGKSKAERQAIIEKYVEMVNLTPAIKKRPAALSGGMRQRVSVARALSGEPEVLLLDEPLSALDALTRANLQDQVLDIWESMKRTVVLITNSVDEGLLMADRIIPLTLGPPATLGPEFVVDIERPRDRRSLNRDTTYQRLRADIVHFLTEQKRMEREREEAALAASA